MGRGRERVGNQTHPVMSRGYQFSSTDPPRRGHPEQHGNQERKIRLVGDFRSSGINSILPAEDTSIPQTLGDYLSRIMLYKSYAPGCVLNSRSVDFAHAYKHVPLTSAQREFATIVFPGPEGKLYTAVLPTQPFGSRRAPASWARVTEFVKWAAHKLFLIDLCVYADDCSIAEPAMAAPSAFHTVQGFCALLGLCLGGSKASPPASAVSLLGAEISLSVDSVTATRPGRKREATVAELEKIRSGNNLIPSEAAKIRGKLGHAQPLLSGKVGRTTIQPLVDRRYSHRPGHNRPLSKEIIEILPRWANISGKQVPRKLTSKLENPIVFNTDTAGAVHIGGMIVYRGNRYFPSSHLPDWLTSLCGIYEFELAAVLAGICAAVEFGSGVQLIL